MTFIKLPVELQVAGLPGAGPDAKPGKSTFQVVDLNVRSAAVLGTSPAQDAPEGSTGVTVVYFNADAGMKPVTTPLTGDEVTALVAAAESA
jgi:hypothetical protein